jgi:hypothetical protein
VTDRIPLGDLTSSDLDQLYGERDLARHLLAKVRETIKSVRELHQRWDADPGSCAHCVDGHGTPLPYPCATIRALDPQEQPTTANCIHPEGYEDECPCPPSCICCQPTPTEA